MDSNLLHVEFFRLMHRFKKLYIAPIAKGLTRGEFFTLEMLRRDSMKNPDAEGMHASALADCLHMSPPAVSRLLRALEARGLIERDVDRGDRRNTFIRLTAQGQAMQADARAQVRVLLSRVMEDMGEQNMRALLALWEQLLDSLEKVERSIGEGEGEC